VQAQKIFFNEMICMKSKKSFTHQEYEQKAHDLGGRLPTTVEMQEYMIKKTGGRIGHWKRESLTGGTKALPLFVKSDSWAPTRNAHGKTPIDYVQVGDGTGKWKSANSPGRSYAASWGFPIWGGYEDQ
jgi:hypothetical protein